MGERGQTTQDFAIGVSVLLVTIIGAFIFTQGGALSVYEGTSPGVQQPQADRIASYIVQEYSVPNQRNTLKYRDGAGSINSELNADQSSSPPGVPNKRLTDLIGGAGADVSSDRRTNPIVNVSIVNGDTLRDGERTPAREGGDPVAWGESRRAEPVTTSRVIDLSNDPSGQCDPVCWLVVRVW